jgi:lipoate-protein ligase A
VTRDLPEAACFAKSFGYEAVIAGRKLMGSAQRRAGGALLQQGSLLVGPGHERLARYLSSGTAAQERALAQGAVTLGELLGVRPDPAPFRAALARAFRHATHPPARPL